MPEPAPRNALPPGHQPRLAITDERPPIRVRIVTERGEYWADGTAHGWTSEVVYVHWSDREGYQHLDYFAASDVERA